MKIIDAKTPTRQTVWLVPLMDGDLLTEGAADLQFSQEPGDYSIVQGGRLVTARLKNQRKATALDPLLGSGRARITNIDQVLDGANELRLTVRFYNGGVVELGDIDIGIDDHALRMAQAMLGMKRAPVEAVAAELEDLCTLALGPRPEDRYFLMTAGNAAESMLDARGRNVQDPLEAARLDQGIERAFRIYAEGMCITVAQLGATQGGGKYLATRFLPSLGKGADGAARLAHGRINFSNLTRTGPVRDLAAGTMARLLAGENSYLKKWDEYGDEEGRLLLERARMIGSLKWHSASQRNQGGTGVEFQFTEALPGGIAAGDQLEIADELPFHLQYPDLSWTEYVGQMDAEAKVKAEQKAILGTEGNRPGEVEAVRPGEVAKVLEVGERSLLLDLHLAPERKELFLVLSLTGDTAQIQRRMAARRRVLDGRSANPMLGLILEEDGEPPPPLRITNFKPLSAFVLKKVFKGRPPTPAQESAIRIALNTPDIALIQGPPGTGKTTVIVAIVERLNELANKETSYQGEVLLSAFQHDAIENMLARLTVNSLPPPKFGNRSGSLDLGDRNAEQIRRWCTGLAEKVRRRNPGLGDLETLLEAKQSCKDYLLAPSFDNALSTIKTFLEVPKSHFPESVVQAAETLKARLIAERAALEISEDPEVMRALWGFRTSVEGFQDDGPTMARNLLDQFTVVELPPAEQTLLREAAEWCGLEPPPWLGELRQLKMDLLERYRPKARFRLDKPREDVVAFISLAQRHLKAGALADSRESILAELLQELENNPMAARQAVEDCSFVFAASCQQSQGTAITQRKQRGAEKGAPVDYDTVIVDEAARSSPRDLLIPMVQARQRIILVGDHRQLPHMINEEIAKTLESLEGADTGEAIAEREASYVRRSMFQYLLKRVGQLEARDRFRRWVTLDQQFRMHRLLGDFVSDQFYRSHDPREAFTSPTENDAFRHGLPGIPEVPALWLNVPAHLGEEMRDGTSRKRQPEARLIAERLAAWIDSSAGRRLTYGIISFYKAQSLEILRALEPRGFTSCDDSGQWRISEPYELRPEEEALPPEERLRIGTVDSFQGMEFDVVFLSMVRSRLRLPSMEVPLADLAKMERTLYGHLTSPNRLCVSMSRQKRLLVVVGDRAMVEHPSAGEAIPGLLAFLRLCEAHGAIIEGGA